MITDHPLLYRAWSKVVFEVERLEGGSVMRSLYVTFRGRGFCVTWGSAEGIR